MNFKIKLMTLISILFLSVSAMAIATPPRHKPDFDRLAQELQVTDAQKDQFMTIMREQHEKRKALHEQGREAVKERMDSLDKALISKLEAVLTPEQMGEFIARMEKRKQDMKMHRMLKAHKGDCCPN